MAADQQGSMNKLPDNIILDILSYLPVKDLCVSVRVCRRWRRIVADNSLWRHVDLLPYRLDLKKMWKVIRTHFSECLITFKVRGFFDREGTKWKKPSLSDAMLEELIDRCPNLIYLHLDRCNTKNLDSQKLPKTLKKLVLQDCFWQPRWFRNSKKLLPNLTHLDLSNTARVDDFDVTDFSNFVNLEVLKLNDCYRVGNGGLEKVAENLDHLKCLEISGTLCSDLSLHHICRHLKTLELLNISKCKGFSNSSLGTIASGLTSLQVLNLCKCSQLNVSGLKMLASSPKLKQLIITEIGLSPEDFGILRTYIGPSVSILNEIPSASNLGSTD